ncbi:hypothetical protein M0802_010729 [Mischocyttarus mexicanus]|nr:hypothetical protein M0802_010729 [Mischocyttarus mexicanus]
MTHAEEEEEERVEEADALFTMQRHLSPVNVKRKMKIVSKVRVRGLFTIKYCAGGGSCGGSGARSRRHVVLYPLI